MDFLRKKWRNCGSESPQNGSPIEKQKNNTWEWWIIFQVARLFRVLLSSPYYYSPFCHWPPNPPPPPFPPPPPPPSFRAYVKVYNVSFFCVIIGRRVGREREEAAAVYTWIMFFYYCEVYVNLNRPSPYNCSEIKQKERKQ